MSRFLPVALGAVLLLTGAAAWGGSKTSVLGKASEIVVLRSVGSANVCGGAGFVNSGLKRVLDDGTETPFVSPPEKLALVVTGIDWQYNLAAAGGRQIFQPYVTNVASPSLYNGLGASSTAIADANGNSGGSLTMTTGFVVGPDATICWRVSPGGGTVHSATFRGYLVKDK